MAKKAKKNYLNDQDLLEEILKSKQKMIDNPNLLPGEAMTLTLAKMFMLLVERIGQKPNWANYSYIQELKQEALVNLVSKWYKFDCEKYDKPFAYFSTVVERSFIGQLNKEKKPQKIKDALLADQGAMPSFRAQEESLQEQIEAMKEDKDTHEVYNEETKNDDSEDV
jgi:hypothetical protein